MTAAKFKFKFNFKPEPKNCDFKLPIETKGGFQTST